VSTGTPASGSALGPAAARRGSPGRGALAGARDGAAGGALPGTPCLPAVGTGRAHRRRLDKGNLSNLASLLVLAGGLAGARGAIPGSRWLLAAGLFGLAGGLTNWLAVRMLFDRVPLLYGSGVIPARFREIRAAVRELVMSHFFAPDYVQRYLRENGVIRQLVPLDDLRVRLQRAIDSPEMDRAIDARVGELLGPRLGWLLHRLGAERVRELVRAAAAETVAALEEPLRRSLDGLAVEPGALCDQVDRLVTAKLEELTPETVKRMVEEVIRAHLGWLVVWGNVFGALIGLASVACGYAAGDP